MSSRRSSVNFAFGNFAVEGGFAVSHQYDRSLGIIRPGQPVSIRATTVPEYTEVNAYVLVGSGPFTPQDIRDRGLIVPFYRSGDAWVATFPGQPDRTTVHYIVEAHHRSGDFHYGDGRLPLARAKVFAHRVTTRRPPTWTKDAVVYQIFVDRFANSAGPVTTPDHEHTFAGGDLWGVAANLDWIKGLGADTVWLTPTFTCTSYHGYDTVDLYSIDERFGGNEALRHLVTEAHGRGMRILLDLVPNHLSSDHPWFQSAIDGGPERDWFFIDDDGSYQMFFSSHTMPKVDLDHPGAREAIIDVAAHWIEEFGVDGYRIDHALGPSESFFAALTERIEAIAPDAWLFGEVTSTPQLSRRYGGILDGVTDFPFAYAIREYFAGRITRRDLAEIERESRAALDPDEFSWVRFVDNHDMARAIHGWNDDPEALASAMTLLFGVPGAPSIFYGTEQALSHAMSEAEGGLSVGRVGMTFDEEHSARDVVRATISRWREQRPRNGEPMLWNADDSGWSWGNLGGSLNP